MVIHRADYRSHPALNASFLKQVYARNYWAAQVPFNATPAMQFGTLAHSYILEPEEFWGEYQIVEGDRRTKAGKQAFADAEAAGKQPISQADFDRVSAMAMSLKAHKETHQLLQERLAVEYSCLFDSPYFADLECKAQIDLISGTTLVDLKTVADIRKAQRQFFDLSYDLQLAFYLDAAQANDFTIDKVQVLFVETAAPYQAALYTVPAEVLANGREKIKIAVERMMQQRQLAYPELIAGEIELPAWAGVISDSEVSPFEMA